MDAIFNKHSFQALKSVWLVFPGLAKFLMVANGRESKTAKLNPLREINLREQSVPMPTMLLTRIPTGVCA